MNVRERSCSSEVWSELQGLSRIAEVEKRNWVRSIPLVVSLLAILVAAIVIEGKYNNEVETTQDEYISEEKETTREVKHNMELAFRNLHLGLQSIAKHPEIRVLAGSDMVTNRQTTQFLVDIANATNENGFPANYYIVSPLGSVGLQVTAIQETHISWKYRKEAVPSSFIVAAKSQLAWFAKHNPVEQFSSSSKYPAVSSRTLIRGLSSAQNATVDPEDAYILYAVPIYGIGNRVKGAVVASISLKGASKMLPNGNFALVEPTLDLALGSGRGTFVGHESIASKGEPATEYIYSEVSDLETPDAIGSWKLWAATTDQRFADRGELKVASQFRLASHFALFTLMILTLAFFRTLNQHRRRLVEIGIGLETEVQQRTTELAHVHKMESIGQLAAGVAHEINTPTQYIGDNVRFLDSAFGRINAYFDRVDSLLESLESGVNCREEFDQTLSFRAQSRLDRLRSEIPSAIDEALEGIRRVSEIVRAMKDYAHPGAHGMSEVDINKVIESTATVARNEWKYVADVEFSLEQSLPQVQCNAGEIGQVILNLIVNAAHAIRDTKRAEKGLIRVSSTLEGNKVVVKVADNGTGIPEKARDRIFEQFYTTKDAGEGTGMGLAIVKKVIENHGGVINFTTATGIGTTFCIELPLEQPDWGAGHAA